MQGFITGVAIGFFLYAGYTHDNVWYIVLGWLFLLYFIVDLALSDRGR